MSKKSLFSVISLTVVVVTWSLLVSNVDCFRELRDDCIISDNRETIRSCKTQPVLVALRQLCALD